MHKYDLNMHIFRLLMSEPFFACLSRHITKIETTSVPTAGVTVNPHTGQFELLYNPYFFEKLPQKEVLGVIKHEFYHLIFDHLTERKPSDKKDAFLWNVATDLAINSFLSTELPEMCCIPGGKMYEDMPPKKASEWYFRKLKQEEKQGKSRFPKIYVVPSKSNDNTNSPNQSNNYGQFDNHDIWIDVENEVQEENIKKIAKERLKGILAKAASESAKAGNWGTVSEECKKHIISNLNTFVDWKKVLRYFILTSIKTNKYSSIRRINKRYPYIHSGKRSTRVANIAISIDQSGSVGDNMLQAFFNELNNLAKIACFTVIPFDSKVAKDKIYKWKKGEKRNHERVLCGGTDFNSPTEYVNEHNFDGHIILTDMHAPKPKPSKCKRIWMTTKDCVLRPPFTTNERIVAISVL